MWQHRWEAHIWTYQILIGRVWKMAECQLSYLGFSSHRDYSLPNSLYSSQPTTPKPQHPHTSTMENGTTDDGYAPGSVVSHDSTEMLPFSCDEETKAADSMISTVFPTLREVILHEMEVPLLPYMLDFIVGRYESEAFTSGPEMPQQFPDDQESTDDQRSSDDQESNKHAEYHTENQNSGLPSWQRSERGSIETLRQKREEAGARFMKDASANPLQRAYEKYAAIERTSNNRLGSYSSDTLKAFLAKSKASPEQWRMHALGLKGFERRRLHETEHGLKGAEEASRYPGIGRCSNARLQEVFSQRLQELYETAGVPVQPYKYQNAVPIRNLDMFWYNPIQFQPSMAPRKVAMIRAELMLRGKLLEAYVEKIVNSQQVDGGFISKQGPYDESSGSDLDDDFDGNNDVEGEIDGEIDGENDGVEGEVEAEA
jgi:hypothetical protein